LSVLQEIRDLVDDTQDELQAWLANRPSWIRATYQPKGRATPFNTLVFTHLLKELAYPDVPGIMDDLTHGFHMVGKLRPGPGWRRRLDDKYNFPISEHTLRIANAEYVERKLQERLPARHEQFLLNEIVEEVTMGRMFGPHHAPAHWTRRTVPVTRWAHTSTLVPPPSQDLLVAASFAIEQQDENGKLKVRRGEDWKRSYHNQAVETHDVPPHHCVDFFVDLYRHLHGATVSPQLFGHDLHSAYRQLPVREPAHCATLLQTSEGPTLWTHAAMLFGAAASVWHFNRFADALQLLVRAFLLVLLGHFVDDFNGAEADDTADSAFQAFGEMFDVLGVVTKPSKAQPPLGTQRVQGVWISAQPAGVQLAPDPQRVHRLRHALATAIEQDSLPADVAQRLVGKLGFLTQSIFGNLGKAAMAPLYSRAAAQGEAGSSLNGPLRSALLCLQHILGDLRPAIIPWPGSSTLTAVLYADAYFQMGDQKFSPQTAPAQLRGAANQNLTNGWGFVLRLGDCVLYDFGTIPPAVLRVFCSRRAFIYFLEIAAQLLPLIAFASQLPAFWVAFIDNAAGEGALRKGWGRGPPINGLLAMFSALSSRLGWHPHFERVKSEDNISDKVSRQDFSQAEALGWTRVSIPIADILDVMVMAASDLQQACTSAVDAALVVSRTFCAA
jgi:hypothetical protein